MARRIILTLFAFATLFVTYCVFEPVDMEEVRHSQEVYLKVGRAQGAQINPVIDVINARNKSVVSFVCGDLVVQGRQEGRNRPVRLEGTIAYQKEKKFRLKLDSVVGNEIDIGSDGRIFWFWSKRLKEPGLYWAKYEDLEKTRLKTPFNPYWLSGCLGYEEIDVKGAEIDQTGTKLRIIKSSTNAQNQPIKVVTIIDSAKCRITGYGLYDSSDTLVASSEIQEFYEPNGIPKKMSFVWYKENAQMVWFFPHPKLNVGVGQDQWVFPNRQPVIDMSRHAGGFVQ